MEKYGRHDHPFWVLAVRWELTADLAARFPLIRSDASVLYVDHGDVATAGASATTVDLCLNQVRCDHGAALAMRIGRQPAAPPHREGRQRQYPRLPTTGIPLIRQSTMH